MVTPKNPSISKDEEWRKEDYWIDRDYQAALNLKAYGKNVIQSVA